jgi:hypothetical protein
MSGSDNHPGPLPTGCWWACDHPERPTDTTCYYWDKCPACRMHWATHLVMEQRAGREPRMRQWQNDAAGTIDWQRGPLVPDNLAPLVEACDANDDHRLLGVLHRAGLLR